jgi:hypothetical protein
LRQWKEPSGCWIVCDRKTWDFFPDDTAECIHAARDPREQHIQTRQIGLLRCDGDQRLK